MRWKVCVQLRKTPTRHSNVARESARQSSLGHCLACDADAGQSAPEDEEQGSARAHAQMRKRNITV
jgi:hypothetical protein